MRSKHRFIEKQLRAMNNYDGDSEDYLENTATLSVHRVSTYRNSKEKAYSRDQLDFVKLTNHGWLVIRCHGLNKPTADTFKYIAKAFDGSAIIRDISGNGSYNVPYSCLIFVEDI